MWVLPLLLLVNLAGFYNKCRKFSYTDNDFHSSLSVFTYFHYIFLTGDFKVNCSRTELLGLWNKNCIFKAWLITTPPKKINFIKILTFKIFRFSLKLYKTLQENHFIICPIKITIMDKYLMLGPPLKMTALWVKKMKISIYWRGKPSSAWEEKWKKKRNWTAK